MKVIMKLLIVSYSKMLLRAMFFSATVFIAGCVSASLDDAGLSASDLTSGNNHPDSTSEALADAGSEHAISKEPSINPLAADEVTLAAGDLPTPVPSAAERFDPEPISRQNHDQAITEIRAKAANTGDAPPQINDVPVSTIKHLTAQQQALSKAELRAEAQAAHGLISDAELAAKRAEIAKLRKKAQSHYNQALQQIQN